MAFKPFEKSKKDKEKKGMKEGSKKEEAMDVAQMGYKRGGKVKCSGGGMMKGGGAATKGKHFSGVF